MLYFCTINNSICDEKDYIYSLGITCYYHFGSSFRISAIAKGWIGYMPPVEELENPTYKFATEIISSDGKMLGTWSLSKENRVYVGYQDCRPIWYTL